MLYLDEELTKIMNEYDEDRAIARIKREKMIKSVHEKLPEVEKIENEINRLGIENFGNGTDGIQRYDQNAFLCTRKNERMRKRAVLHVPTEEYFRKYGKCGIFG